MEPIKDISEIKKNDPIMVMRWIKKDDRSYMREVFQVRAVDPPYVAVHCGRPHVPIRTVLDFREVEFGRPSEEFVKAVRPEIMGPNG